jgi:hypothetical protein
LAALPLVLAGLDKRVAGRSAEQSCVEPVVAVALAALVLWVAEIALECSALDSVPQAAQYSLLEPKGYGLPEERPEPKPEER